MFSELSREDDQVAAATSAQGPSPRSGRDRDWGARIRASITRLMEIDGICLGPKNYANMAEKNKARVAEQAFHARVDELEAASATAHKKYWDRLQHVYSASTAKKMRLTSTEPLQTTMAKQSRHENEALDALAVAAATSTQQLNQPETLMEATAATKAKKGKRISRWHNSLPLDDGAGKQQLSRLTQ